MSMNEEENKGIEDSPVEEYVRPGSFWPKFWVKFTVLVSIVILAFVFKSTVLDKGISPEELKSSIEIFDISSQWVEKEKIDEKDFKGIILVPEISFRTRNVGKRELQHVFILGVFRLLNSPRAMGEGYEMLFKEPVKPGGTSGRIVLRSGFGYKATSKKAFEINSQKWRSAEVEIYARSHDSGLVFLKSFYISRKIEGLDVEIKVL